MGKIDSSDDELPIRCQRILSEGGRLTTALSGYTARAAQISLATSIAKAICQQSTLVAEAGTGTGKTYAYLIPCLISNKKVIISTATKTLQDQLYNKDLPTLIKALGLGLQVQNLKGRANYICRYRLQLHVGEGRFVNPQVATDLIHIHKKAPQLISGDRAELPEVKEESPVWPYATSTVDNCLGGECAFYQTCFLTKARKRALDADIVVINHHLFFADSRLKEEGFGELLPGAEVIVFDEAHQLTEIAANFHGERLSSRQLSDTIAELLKEWPLLDLANQPLKKMSFDIDQAIDALLCLLPGEKRVSWEHCKTLPEFNEKWRDLVEATATLSAAVEKEDSCEAGLKRAIKRVLEIKLLVEKFDQNDSDSIRWIECFKQSLIIHATPLSISQSFSQRLARQKATYIFTSATLALAENFHSFTKPLGLTESETLYLPSPFNYQQQALLYLPRGMPDPNHADYYNALVLRALPLIKTLGGRCFILFTSHHALKKVAQLLNNNLEYPLLIQGTESKSILLARFRELGNAVLLGTATFWEGVDVKGDALSCVIIDKLPFSSPVDPITQGKMAFLKKQGLSAFDELSLPAAVLALKQGVGRLIRDENDKGVLMISDPRLTAREYGRSILASLPPLARTRDETRVLHFIHQLGLSHEPISA